MSEKTISEYLFEEFCDSNGIPYRRIPTRSSDGHRTPDYDIFFSDQKVITEVKQIEPNKEERQNIQNLEGENVGSYEWYGDSASRVRKKIKDAIPQLKARTEGKFPSLLVLYNTASLISYLTDRFAILTAMYGREALVISLPKDKEPNLIDVKFGGERKVSKNYNTSLSAVAVINKSEVATVHLDIYHNIYARIKFNPNWLRGQSVNHFSLKNKENKKFQDWIKV